MTRFLVNLVCLASYVRSIFSIPFPLRCALLAVFVVLVPINLTEFCGSLHNATVADLYRKPRQQKEKDDKVKDDEGAGGVKGEQEAGAAGVPTGSEQQQQPYVMPGDNTLVKHVEEVQLKIAPLPTTRDQVIALAQYVLHLLALL